MMAEEIKKFFKGEVLSDEATLATYSKDASLFTVKPQVVVYPQDAEDLQNLVKWAKDQTPSVSITMRSAGSDMSGGPLNNGIIADVTKHLNKVSPIDNESVAIEPGVFYRDLEPQTLAKDLLLPCYPASKDLAALGGMVANNCGGELTLRYGKMENFVLESKYILSDGEEYLIKPLTREELEEKMAQNNFEGQVYKQTFELIEKNKALLAEAKPKVSKNSAGYFLWNVWDGEKFDLNKLLTGAQGTLGIMTSAKLKLVPVKKHHDLVALFFNSWSDLPKVVNTVLPFEPQSLETFDKATIKLGLKFMPEIAKKAHSNLISFALKFLPEAWLGVRLGGLPELVVLVEIAESSEEEVRAKRERLVSALKPLKVLERSITKDSEEEKFWVMRRESFNLLRKHVANKRTVPLIDDFCIPPQDVPEFLPQARAILEKNGIDVNIAGHAGDGNFHIIPLMDLSQESERKKLIPVAEEFYNLVAKYHGTTTGEHNDGLVRTPFLNKIYKPEVLELFKQTKAMFDPQNIFNPKKKVGATLEDFEKALI